MFEALRKIISVGTVTKEYDENIVSKKFRGEVECIYSEKCVECKKCINLCPTGAIASIGIFFNVKNKQCIYCGRCTRVCQGKVLANSNRCYLAELGENINESSKYLLKKIRKVLGRSLHLRHLDVGSCNACDFELTALNNPVYDLQHYGIDFVASPRHADMLMVTGMISKNSLQALQKTYEAMPTPKLVMAVGSCATGAAVFGESYAVAGKLEDFLPVDVYVPGCPPRPSAIIYALLLILGKIEGKKND